MSYFNQEKFSDSYVSSNSDVSNQTVEKGHKNTLRVYFMI